MPPRQTCEECGAEIPINAPQGLCPRCLAGVGLDMLRNVALPKSDEMLEHPGSVIGRYKLLEKIGEGGFGVVYMAEQQEPVQRKVALKIIKPGMDTREVIARFDAERQAIALMDHPNIARVLDAGATDAGRPYFVMELVRGIPITDYCDQKNLPTRERLQLFMKVCQAVQHAHQKAVIHRDLKPNNVLVTEHDGEPVPKVIDFGVAKALGQKLTEKTLFTGFHQMLGTPAYMSPEQAALSGLDIDTRADIYSLGVLLYELLTGVTPFDTETFRKAALDEIRQMIRDTEPPKPSTRLQTLGEKITDVAKHRHTEPASLSRLIRGDLDWIVMRCLEKDRKRRYETANALAQDLERHLNVEPIVARPPSALYQFQKLVRRNKLAFAAASAVFVSLAIGLAGMTWTAIRLRQTQEEGRQILYAADMNLASRDFQDGNTEQALERLERHIPTNGQTDLRGFEWHYLWRQCRGNYSQWLPVHPQIIGVLRFSPDGSRIAAYSWANALTVWNIEAKKNCFTAEDVTGFGGFTADGSVLVIGRGDESIQLLQAQAGATNRVIPEAGVLVAWAANGQSAAAIGRDEILRVWSLTNAQVRFALTNVTRRKMDSGWGYPVALSPDGNTLAVIERNASPLKLDVAIRLWDVMAQKELPPLPLNRQVRCLEFSPNGKVLAVGDGDGNVQLWSPTAAERPLLDFQAHKFPVLSLAFSPDGRSLATGSSDKNCIRLWDVATGLLRPNTFRGQVGDVWSLTFSPDGKRLASGTRKGPIRIWNLEKPEVGEIVEAHLDAHEYGNFIFSSDGQWMAGGCTNNTIRIWETATLRIKSILTNATYVAAFSEDGQRVLVSTLGGLPHWENVEGSTVREIPRYTGNLASMIAVDLTPNRQVAALGLSDGLIQRWEVESGRPVGAPLEGHIGLVRSLAFSARGDKLASGGTDKSVRVWDAKTGRPLGESVEHKGSVCAVAFSPNGKILASGCGAETIKLWDVDHVRDGSEVSVNHHKSVIRTLAFSPDGLTLASGSEDDTVKLWRVDLRQGSPELREVASFTHEAHLRLVVFSPDGNTLATVTDRGTLRVFRAASLKEASSDPLMY